MDWERVKYVKFAGKNVIDDMSYVLQNLAFADLTDGDIIEFKD